VPPAEDGAAEVQEAPTLTYLAGRIFLDKNGRWVYESFNHAFTSDKHPNLVMKLAEIHRTSEADLLF
jgi:hypothetical protein